MAFKLQFHIYNKYFPNSDSRNKHQMQKRLFSNVYRSLFSFSLPHANINLKMK